MKPSRTLILNDVHVGVNRTGGTTHKSSAELKAWVLQRYGELLQLAPANGCDRIVLNGDCTDIFDVPLGEALELYAITAGFLGQNPDIKLFWAVGNHDLSRDSSKLGTVVFVGALLKMRHDNFDVITSPGWVGRDIYVIPHVRNQEIFEMELGRVPDSAKALLLHCNYENRFACEKDESLNLARADAKKFTDRGVLVILGHEHQGRELLGGKLVVVGNQIPSSVADCLGNNTKRAMVLTHG